MMNLKANFIFFTAGHLLPVFLTIVTVFSVCFMTGTEPESGSAAVGGFTVADTTENITPAMGVGSFALFQIWRGSELYTSQRMEITEYYSESDEYRVTTTTYGEFGSVHDSVFTRSQVASKEESIAFVESCIADGTGVSEEVSLFRSGRFKTCRVEQPGHAMNYAAVPFGFVKMEYDFGDIPFKYTLLEYEYK